MPGMSIAGWVSGVTIRPGAIALTRTPFAPSSSAPTSVSIDRPAFEAQDGAGLAGVERRQRDDRAARGEPLSGVLHHDERAREADVDDPAPLGDIEVDHVAQRGD